MVPISGLYPHPGVRDRPGYPRRAVVTAETALVGAVALTVVLLTVVSLAGVETAEVREAAVAAPAGTGSATELTVAGAEVAVALTA